MECEGRQLDRKRLKLQNRIQECDQMMQTAKNRENDALIPYGKDIKRVLETIKKMRWYGDEPLGPLGWILDGIVSNISYIPPVAHSRPTTFQVTLS